MNLSALPELLLAWAKTQGAALLQGNKAEQASPFKVGAEYEGKVLDQLPSGRHLVQVAGQKLDMGLPRNTQTGDSVRLTFLNAGPRPTFLLNNQGPVSSAQQVQISNTAQQVSALMRIAQPVSMSAVQAAAPAAGQPAGQAAQASSQPGSPVAGQVAKQISTSLPLPVAAASAKVAGQVAVGSPTASQAINQAANPPSASARVTTTGQIIQALPAAQNQPAVQAAVARPIVANVVMLQSYSAAGANAPTAVASANTALLGQAVDSLRAAAPASTTLRPTVLADPASPSPNLLPTRLSQTLRESGLFYESHLARWTKGAYPFESILNEPQARLGRAAMPMPGMAELAGMHEDAARMAGRQLHMLEGGPFLWQGFAWPGQWMDWLVDERREGQGDGHEGEEPNPWDTELRLTLPRMGTVHAQLSLRDHDVNLRLQVAEPATARTLQEALPDLQRGLESSGLRPVSLTVSEVAG